MSRSNNIPLWDATGSKLTSGIPITSVSGGTNKLIYGSSSIGYVGGYSAADINFGEVYDPNGNFDGTNYTAPESAYYYYQVYMPTQQITTRIYVNNSETNSLVNGPAYFGIKYLNLGDVFKINIYNQSQYAINPSTFTLSIVMFKLG